MTNSDQWQAPESPKLVNMILLTWALIFYAKLVMFVTITV